MVTVIKAKRKSAVLTPSSLACLAVLAAATFTEPAPEARSERRLTYGRNITGTWPRRSPRAIQPMLIKA